MKYKSYLVYIILGILLGSVPSIIFTLKWQEKTDALNDAFSHILVLEDLIGKLEDQIVELQNKYNTLISEYDLLLDFVLQPLLYVGLTKSEAIKFYGKYKTWLPYNETEAQFAYYIMKYPNMTSNILSKYNSINKFIWCIENIIYSIEKVDYVDWTAEYHYDQNLDDYIIVEIKNRETVEKKNVEFIWLSLLQFYNESTINTYKPLFRNIIGVYSRLFIDTSGFIKSEYPVEYVDENEFLLVKELIDLYINWDLKNELIIDLKTSKPLYDLSLNNVSVDEYYKYLAEPPYFSRPNYMVTLMGSDYWHYSLDWYSEASEGKIPVEHMKYLSTKYVMNELIKQRHDEIWNNMNDPSVQLSNDQHLLNKYNYTEWDKKIYVVERLTEKLHLPLVKELTGLLPECGTRWDEETLNLRSIGFSSATAHYEGIQAFANHISTAPWKSKYFIQSQEKFGGQINWHNFVPRDMINKDQNRFRWSSIDIFREGEKINVFTLTLPYFDTHDLEYSTGISTKLNNTIYDDATFLISSINGFSDSVLFSANYTEAYDKDYNVNHLWYRYPAANYSIIFTPNPVMLEPNATEKIYVRIIYTPYDIIGEHRIYIKAEAENFPNCDEIFLCYKVEE